VFGKFKGKLRNLLALTAAAGLLLTGCAGAAKDGGKAGNQDVIKIGAVLDTTGTASSLGVPERDTLQMLVEDINAKGGVNGKKLEVIIEDSASDETKAVLAVKKLITKDKVLAVIGASTSGTTMAMVKTAEANKVPLISLATSEKIVNPLNERKYIFKVAPSDTIVAGKMMDYLKAKGIKKVAFLSMNNTFGDTGRDAFEKMAKAEGIEIVLQEKFEATDKDMTSQLTKVKGSDAQATIVWAIPPSASIVTKNYRQLDLKIPLIHSHGVGNKNFLELAGPDANGVVFPIGKILLAEQLPDSDPQKRVLLDYAKAYEAKYGPRSTFGGHAWDAVYMLKNAIEKAGTDSAKIRDEIEKTSNFVAISGVFNLSPSNHNGVTKDAMVMAEITNGEWKLVQ